ncbi:MFS transporter [Promethearchaeum syntrophicum]|uniref:MFS transporter n=1 Tax=Promethearchaeum syntrophicum TaxID=2594042 RepID=A0A5B9D922_9ARCH|nr:MFS transporter [Candidatus Prometheoarchaeum syntrophicum]QEE15521.1 melibiose:sodium symporter [Candidatus Prometheoarchaeum syntrophicum]
MEENIQTTRNIALDYKQPKHSAKTTMAFGFGAMTDQMSHQAFQFLIFTYYFAVVGVGVTTLAVSFIIFAIWDSINDPLLGPLSDKTKSKFGRRRFWIIVSFIPFALINIFLFTPPKFWRIGPTSEIVNGIYMVFIIMLYDLIYTIFSINQLSLFPEMFKNEKARGRANKYKNLLTIIGLLIGFVVPTLIINPMVPEVDTLQARSEVSNMYLQTGLMIAAFVVLFSVIFFMFGMKEDKKELQEEIQKEKTPGIFESLKTTMKNKTFIIFITANLFTWTTFKMFTTILTLYGIHVIGIESGEMLLTILLLAALLTAAALFPVMEWLGNKIGYRNAFMVTEGIWIAALIPFLFLDNRPIAAVICMVFVGIGLSGAMYFTDIIIGRVIDEDELNTGLRRQGSFYGVNALINRYSTIVVFLSIAIVLTGYGFENYLVPSVAGEGIDYTGLKTGLKILMVGVSGVSLLIVLILLKLFPLHGEKWDNVQKKLLERRRNS